MKQFLVFVRQRCTFNFLHTTFIFLLIKTHSTKNIAHFSVSLFRHLQGVVLQLFGAGSTGRMSSSSSPSSWWMSSRVCIRAYFLVLSQVVLITSAVKRRKNSRAVVNCLALLRDVLRAALSKQKDFSPRMAGRLGQAKTSCHPQGDCPKS